MFCDNYYRRAEGGLRWHTRCSGLVGLPIEHSNYESRGMYIWSCVKLWLELNYGYAEDYPEAYYIFVDGLPRPHPQRALVEIWKDSLDTVQDIAEPCVVCLCDQSDETSGVSRSFLEIQECGHAAHSVCLIKWLTSTPNCPVCRCLPVLSISTS